MERETEVFIDLAGATVPVGTLWTRTRGARQTASFEYAARPKATVRAAEGHLLIAKFPRSDDEWPVTRWEAVALALAQAAGIEVAPFRLRRASNRAVLTARRFDRREGRRIAFTSALTALEATDHDAQRSYLEIAEFLRREGGAADQDLRQLWRRLAFNVLISNTDDHLRNHGFLRAPHGWRLAPAYDLNPVPVDVKPRVHALALDEFDGTASLETALAVAPWFGMTERAARAVMAEVGRAVSRWREAAALHGLTPADVERMASAFDHRDARTAAAAAAGSGRPPD